MQPTKPPRIAYRCKPRSGSPQSGVRLEGCEQMERLFLGIMVTSTYTLVTMALILTFIE
jgi:hypothetical protein